MEFNRLLSSVISTYGEYETQSNQETIINKKKNLKIIKKNYQLIKNEKEIEKWLKYAE